MNDAPEIASPPEPAQPAKVDPETLVLRAKPGRVVRFRRGLIIGAMGLGSAVLVGIAWVALEPVSFNLVAEGENQVGVDRKGTPEAMAGAPSGYGDIPRLGPPLPGDLGQSILDRQRQLAGTTENGPSLAGAEPADQAFEAEHQRLAAERKAAREASLLVQRTGGASPAQDIAPSPVSTENPPSELGRVAGTGGADPNGQGHKAGFLNSSAAHTNINPHSLAPAPSPWTLSAGSIIAASLLTGLNSDLPGFVTAQVTENARDTVTGKTVLIPQGSRLIGKYDSVVAFGQRRALVVWQRIILPDGSSLAIDNMPATDTAGYAGLVDKVDVHSWQLLKGIGLSTLLGVGTQLGFGSDESDLVRALRESAQQNGDRVGQQITAKNLDIQPSITVRPGWPLRVVVHKDIVLQPWRGGR